MSETDTGILKDYGIYTHILSTILQLSRHIIYKVKGLKTVCLDMKILHPLT